MIIDLSFPPDHSVNAGVPKSIYLGTAFKLHYPTIDMITQRLCDIGPGAHIYKIDLACAFRQLFVDPSDWDLLGLHWDGGYYGDCRVPFGYRNGSMFLTRFTDYIRYIMRSKGHHIVNYVDDLLGLESQGHSTQSYQFLRHLLDRAGFSISLSKLAPPSTTCVCLGVIIDTVKETVTIPPDKLSQILDKCTAVQKSPHISKNQLQSLLGSLMFLHRGVKATRVFTNRLLEALRNMNSNTVQVTEDMRRDLKWFTSFVHTYNGYSSYRHPTFSDDTPIELDASLKGLGGRWGSCVYRSDIPGYLLQLNISITHLELFNVFVALKVWGPDWAARKLVIRLDNSAAVSIINSGFTRDTLLATIARNIWFEGAVNDIQIWATHVPGVKNQVADLLSRWEAHGDPLAALKKLMSQPKWYPVEMAHLFLRQDI